MNWKGHLKRDQRKMRRVERLLVKLLIVDQEREKNLVDPVHISLVNADLLDRDHPNPVSKPSRHPEVHCRSNFVKPVAKHTVKYAIEPQEHILIVEGPDILLRIIQVHAILGHLLLQRD